MFNPLYEVVDVWAGPRFSLEEKPLFEGHYLPYLLDWAVREAVGQRGHGKIVIRLKDKPEYVVAEFPWHVD